MHPDAIIAGLKAELEEARDDEHRKQIEAEIKRVDELPRPAAKPDEPETVFDRARAYLDGLKVELEEAAESRVAEIKKEIKRVEDEIAARSEKPDKSERAQRSASRATNEPKAERAVSAPAN